MCLQFLEVSMHLTTSWLMQADCITADTIPSDCPYFRSLAPRLELPPVFFIVTSMEDLH